MSYNVYPVIKLSDICDSYQVKINGALAELNTARVSAFPFNRRWPGHQRQMDQSELVNFLSMETDEAVEFEIIPKEPFENVVIRPLSLGITPVISDGVIRFRLEKPAYFTVEPYGRRNALHVFCDDISEYDVDFDSEDVLYFGAGEHDVGVIDLKSNQTLFIDRGAVVYGCVTATDADNIRILGRGILDNSKNTEQILFEANAVGNTSAVNNAKRRHTIQPEYCSGVKIDGITIRDSLVYNIRPLGCDNLRISDVKIIGCWRYNSDGIDMHNCRDVVVENCFIRTFDDAVCVKGFDFYNADAGDNEAATKNAMYRNGKAYDVFCDTVVRNCVIWNDWGKSLEIGAETKAEEIFDIVFEDCDIIHITGSPLDCCNVDFADVHDVVYRNINVEYDDVCLKPLLQQADDHCYVNSDDSFTPPLICVMTIFHPEYSGGGTRRGRCRKITFSDIKVFGRHYPKFYFEGCDNDHQTSDITVSNLYLNGEKITGIDEAFIEKNEFTANIVFQ